MKKVFRDKVWLISYIKRGQTDLHSTIWNSTLTLQRLVTRDRNVQVIVTASSYDRYHL